MTNCPIHDVVTSTVLEKEYVIFFEHANFTVSDLGRSIAFYRELFGFRLRWQGTTSNGAPAAHIGDQRIYIALFQAVRPGSVEQDYDRVGINHVGFVVDDLTAMKKRLATLGVTPYAEADYQPGRRLYFRDPDGIEIELVEYDEQAN